MFSNFLKIAFISFVLIFSLDSVSMAASAVVWEENFNRYDIGTTNGTVEDLNSVPVPWDTAAYGCGWLSVQDNPFSSISDNNWMEAGGFNILGYWFTDRISISGYSDVAVSMDIGQTGDMESSGWWKDSMALFYSITDTVTESRSWILFDYEVGSFGSTTGEVSDLSGNFLSLAVVMKNTAYGETHGFDNVKVTATTVPVPTSILLLGSGIVGLAGLRRKIRK